MATRSFSFRRRRVALGPAEAHLVAGLFEVVLLDEFLVVHGGEDGGLVDDGGQVGAAEHRGAAGDPLKVDVRAELHLAGVDFEDFHAALDVGQRDVDLAVEPARAREGGIEHVDAVGGGDDDDLVVGLEAVHLDEDGVEGLLALVVPAGGEPAAAATADGVDFIQEDDAGRVVLGLLEEVADAGGAHADEHLHEVRAGDGEEGHVGLAGDGLGQQGLAAPGSPTSSTPRGDAPAQALEFLGVLEELDDLHDFFLGLVDAGDVGEGDVGHFLG